MNTFGRITIIVSCILIIVFSYMWKKEIINQETKKVWVNKEHTACHFQDTLEVNDIKYLKVYDKDNSGFYGDPYLVPVN